jgi:hypothetical protein
MGASFDLGEVQHRPVAWRQPHQVGEIRRRLVGRAILTRAICESLDGESPTPEPTPIVRREVHQRSTQVRRGIAEAVQRSAGEGASQRLLQEVVRVALGRADGEREAAQCG